MKNEAALLERLDRLENFRIHAIGEINALAALSITTLQLLLTRDLASSPSGLDEIEQMRDEMLATANEPRVDTEGVDQDELAAIVRAHTEALARYTEHLLDGLRHPPG